MSNLHKCTELENYLQEHKSLIIEIEKYGDDWEMYIENDDDYRECTSKTIDIKYCPFCGQKLD